MELKKCEEIADEIQAKYNPKGLSPFPYENIENDIPNLTIVYFPFADGALKSLSGAIVYDTPTTKFRVLINEDRPGTRQYFTIAHELGHYFLHQDIIKTEGIIVDTEFFDGDRAFFREDGSNNLRLEKEANCFASALLMPSELVKKAWSELKSVEECARVFRVSVSAMSIRLERLNLLSV